MNPISRRVLAGLVLVIVGLGTACVDVVVSLSPWFEVAEGESQVASFDARLLGAWCDDDEEECGVEQVMVWKQGPGKSFNVFGEGRLRYRVWLAEIEGTLYLDWWFLCEPSTGVEADDCMGLDFPLGTHIAGRVDRLDEHILEFRILEGEKLEEYMAVEPEPLEGSRADGMTLILEDTPTLQEFLGVHGDVIDLWSEEPVRLVRRSGQDGSRM